MEKLKKTLESIVPILSKQDLDSRFPKIAEFFMKNYGIENNKKRYLINEIEFYYYDPLYRDLRNGSGNSTITYGRTAPAGCWFIHNYGVDLTFYSDEKQGFGGGILIRSIEELNSSKTDPFTVGPVNCVNELWEEAVDAFCPTAPNPIIVPIEERKIELNEPDIRVTVGKYDEYKSKWRFVVKGTKVSK